MKSNNQWGRLVAFAAVLLVLGSGAAFAQLQTGNLYGKVSDQAGAASQTLTISDGPGTTPATVTGVTGFAWEPLNPN